MLFSLAVSWRFACLIAIVIAPAKRQGRLAKEVCVGAFCSKLRDWP
jgi:hypothetical protein